MANSSDPPSDKPGRALSPAQHDNADEDELSKQKRSRRGGVVVPVIVVAAGSRLHGATEALNASPSGLFIACDPPAMPIGTRVEILLTAQDEEEPVRVVGTVVRHSNDPSPGMGIQIDRNSTPPPALQRYRALILHAIRHRPVGEAQEWSVPDTTLEDVPSLRGPESELDPSDPDKS